MVTMESFAQAFGFDAKSSDTWTTLGKVTAVSGNTLSVKLGGSTSTTECEAYCLADVDDVVFVVITNGAARAVACKGGCDKVLNSDFTIKRTEADSTLSNNGLLSTSYLYYGWKDKNGLFTGWAGNVASTDGSLQTQLAARKRINNANVDNILRLTVNADGTKTVTLSDPAAWRTALGI